MNPDNATHTVRAPNHFAVDHLREDLGTDTTVLP